MAIANIEIADGNLVAQLNNIQNEVRKAESGAFKRAFESLQSKETDKTKEQTVEEYLSSKFAGRSEVNEEEVYQALVAYKLEGLSPEVGALYAAKLNEMTPRHTKSNGYVAIEDLTNATIDALVSAGGISAEDAAALKADAFKNAQLDLNPSALWDSIGGGEDKTIAVASVTKAVELVRGNSSGDRGGDVAIQGVISSAPTADSLATAEADAMNAGALSSNDGKGGFLWKPVSDSNGRLVILLPRQMNGFIQSVEIHSSVPPSAATMIAEGRYASIGNGGRCHFRFPKPGAAYGNNIHVVVRGTDGTYVSYHIPRGGSRWD